MKVLTVLGTRPEIIRLSCIIPKLDAVCDHILVNTGQNFDTALNELFFRELQIRRPDYSMEIKSSNFSDQLAQIFRGIGEILDRVKPDRLLVLGDTNSALSAIVAARSNIPVYHMEAGNRCYDNKVPEEVNRRLIDHCSTVLLPYTYRSRENLLREGIPADRIVVTGNPINEVLRHNATQIAASQVQQILSLSEGKYFLATVHRAENVEDGERLQQLFEGLSRVADCYNQPLVVSLHPRTADRLSRLHLASSKQVKLISPPGFFDFVRLEQGARCVLTDSGTVQEECCLFGVPAVTLRNTTERPETVEAGSNILSGVNPDRIEKCVAIALSSNRSWTPPAEYLEPNCSEKIASILMSFHAGFE